MMNRRREMLKQVSGGGRLPAEYQEVEYTQINNTSDNYKNFVQLKVSSANLAYMEMKTDFVDAIADDDTLFFICVSQYTSGWSRFGVQRITVGGAWRVFNVYLTCSSAKFVAPTYTIDGSVSCVDKYVMRLHGYSDSTGCGSAKWYYLTMYNSNNDKILEFVPCYIKATGEYGFYDLVTNSFFGNSGTLAFTGGDPV